MSLAGLEAVMLFDLATFAVAFLTLAAAIRIPSLRTETSSESPLQAVGQGVEWLRRNRGILDLILFLAAINLVASVYNAALPAMLLSRSGGRADGPGPGGDLYRRGQSAGEPGSLSSACAPQPGEGHLWVAVFRHEHGKSDFGPGAQRSGLVRGGGPGLAADSGDEHQSWMR